MKQGYVFNLLILSNKSSIGGVDCWYLCSVQLREKSCGYLLQTVAELTSKSLAIVCFYGYLSK